MEIIVKPAMKIFGDHYVKYSRFDCGKTNNLKDYQVINFKTF